MSAETVSSFHSGKEIGDYFIGKLVSKGTTTTTWEAIQISVQREVLVCSLDAEYITDDEIRESFIADVRIKATVDHPLIATILEAINEGAYCFFAYEKIKGRDLGELHERGESISPLHAARTLVNISSACEYLESRNIATLNLSTHNIFVDQDFHCRISNLAVSGYPQHADTKRDKELVGHLIQDIIGHNQPGTTRMSTLLGSMAYLNNTEPKSWREIHELAAEIERQLTKSSASVQINTSTRRINSVAMRYLQFSSGAGKILIIVLALLAIMGLTTYLLNKKPKAKKLEIADMVNIPAGKYPGPYGFHIGVRGFWIDAHEVTIEEYAKFLKAINDLPGDMKTVYQHSDQPSHKLSHQPDDWTNLYAAARDGKKWNGFSMELYHPVVGVDWWDAHAYAQWKGRSLPSYEDWYAACSASSDPSALQGSNFQAVDKTVQTAIGLYGMAGNVAEWMRDKVLDPANPFAPPRYVIAGASYLRPQSGAEAREWVDDRSMRRPDLGFRTCNPAGQRD